MKDGADLCVDSIGGDSFHSLLHLAKQGSWIVTFGATAGPIPQMVMPKIFLKQIDILGTTLGSPNEFKDMLSFFSENQIRPMIDTVYPFETFILAQNRVEKGLDLRKSSGNYSLRILRLEMNQKRQVTVVFFIQVVSWRHPRLKIFLQDLSFFDFY